MNVSASQKHLKAAGIARIVSKNYKRNEIHNSTKKKAAALSLLLIVLVASNKREIIKLFP
jgi:hypothetical protein